jgi:hypothetical protein
MGLYKPNKRSVIDKQNVCSVCVTSSRFSNLPIYEVKDA